MVEITEEEAKKVVRALELRRKIERLKKELEEAVREYKALGVNIK